MTTAPTPLHQECTDFATSLRSASSVAMTTKGAAPPSFLRAADLFECAAAELRRLQAENERLQAKNASMRTTLEYVERWANHHGTKPHITAEQALGCIQHHPDIHDITRGYADGKRPDTFDPYARIAELEARKPLPLSYDARLRLRSDVARAIWDVMREHEDRCDHALEDVEPKHQVWDCADAAIETALGIIPRPNPLIARREVVAGGPVRVTRLHLTEEGRAGLTSNATGLLPGITGGSS